MNQGRDPLIFLTPEADDADPAPMERSGRSWMRWSRSGRGGVKASPAGGRGWVIAGLAVVAAAALLVATGWLGAARTWLGGRPEHQVRWNDLQLVPAPPAYIRSGAAGLLAGVRKRLGGPETLSTLAQDWDELARAFPLGSPWVEQVDTIAVEGYPNRLRVALVYRRPTAVLGGVSGPQVILDAHGVVLPADDLDLAGAGRLIRIDGWSGTIEPRPGLALAAQGSPEERRLLAATRLAGFVRNQTSRDNITPSAPLLQAVNLRYGERYLFAQTRDGLWVLWGEAPGQESPGQLSAEQKWDFLRDWLARNPPVVDQPGSYLVFSRSGASLQAGKRSGAERKPGPVESGG